MMPTLISAAAAAVAVQEKASATDASTPSPHVRQKESVRVCWHMDENEIQ